MCLYELGYYSIASALASLPLMLANPVTAAIFPKFTKMFESNDISGLVKIYHKTCRLTSILIVPATLTLVFFAKEFILAWTSNSITANAVGYVTGLLLIGQLLQAITLVPFNYALSNGNTKLIIQVQIFSIIIMTPLLYLLLKNFGLVGGGISWLLMNVLSLPPYMYYFHKKYLPGELKNWIIYDIGQPLLISFPVVCIGYYYYPNSSSVLLTFIYIGLIWVLSSLATILIFEDSREFIKRFIWKKQYFK
jgi:O-antigen/teichoic acid export membrane protein